MAPRTQTDQNSFDELLLAIVDKLETQEFDLPPLPQVTNRVLDLTTDPGTTALQLTGLIQQDPAHHMASHFVDSQAISEDALRVLPVVQVLQLSNDAMNALLIPHDSIRAQINTMLT